MTQKLIDLLVHSEDERERLHRELVVPRLKAVISADHLDVIKDWYHFAILSLLELDDFRSEPEWIAKRLGISVKEASGAIDRLIRVGLVKMETISGRERLYAKQLSTTTSHDVPSWALRESHRQTLEQTIRALEEVPVEMRDITSLTMAIDVDKIPEAKREIRVFRRKLCRLLESGHKKEVFNLNIQLVPVTKL